MFATTVGYLDTKSCIRREEDMRKGTIKEINLVLG